MKRTRHTEEQIAFCLRQHEAGALVGGIIRKMGITEQTFYRWKKKFAGMGAADVRRQQLEEENRKRKQLVAARKAWLDARSPEPGPPLVSVDHARFIPGARRHRPAGKPAAAKARLIPFSAG